ncbi:MAG: tRNA preQ1(34) S-adenosylmethionine ribosyltransferase-isomerase QueA [Firmicutes bacterium]|nr:tRNA preQ1(34) S-adenosylmethionine ribosyltransferase-isomerase QueA [Bacillota bacterium]
MRVRDFYYYLPQELIAQKPIDIRDKSRLMIVDKNTGAIEHGVFRDVVKYLQPGDCLVLNDTRVIPARLFGHKLNTGGRIEFVLLRRIDIDRWEVLVKPGKRAREGTRFGFGEGQLEAEVLENTPAGGRIVRFEYSGVFENVLERLGTMPLPPYIKERLDDPERYQTVYSKEDGSAAAPTAGLHFTDDLLEKIREKGVRIAYITLHVGLGTFRPVKAKEVERHIMHSEYYRIDQKACKTVNDTMDKGGSIIAVGTTSCRTLETVASEKGVTAGEGWTDIFIYPGYNFKVVDGMITNFHLPESTLIMLVSALVGRENIMNAYRTAIEEKYRFYSFGDAMLLI